MKNKTVTVRIDEKTLERLNYYRCIDELVELSQSEFIIQAINEKCEAIRSHRAGELSLRVTNPQFIIASNSKKVNSRKILLDCMNDLNANCPGLDFGIESILAYATQRLLTDSDNHRNKLENNFYTDMKFENKFNTDSNKSLDDNNIGLGLHNMDIDDVEKIFDIVDKNFKLDENSFNADLRKFRSLIRKEILRREED